MSTYVYNLTFTGMPKHKSANGLFDPYSPAMEPPPNGYSKAWYEAPSDWNKDGPTEPGPITQDSQIAPVLCWPLPTDGELSSFKVCRGDRIFIRVATHDGKWSRTEDVFWGLSIGFGRGEGGSRPDLATPFELGKSAKDGAGTPAALFFIPSIPGISQPLCDGSWLYYLGKIRSSSSPIGSYGFIVCLAAGNSKGVYNWGNDPQMDVTG